MNSHKHEHTGENCRELLSTLSEFIDDTLDETMCTRIQQHMEGCENCRIVVDTLRKTVTLYRDTATPEPVPDPIRERLYKKLNLEDFLGTSD